MFHSHTALYVHPSLETQTILLDVMGGEDGNHESTSISSRSNVPGTGVIQISNSTVATLMNDSRATLLHQLLMMDLQDSADKAGGTSSDLARQNGEA